MVLTNVLSNKRVFFYFGALLFSLASIFFTFFDEKIARISFFVASYISIAGLILYRPRMTRENISFSIALALLGLSKLFWFIIEYVGNPKFDIYNSYLATGKRMLLAIFIAWFLISLKKYYVDKSTKFIKWFFIAAFVVACSLGLYQHATGVTRIDFYQGRATDAAYMFAALSVAVIIILAYDSHYKLSLLFGFVAFLLAMWLIFLTGTRNVIATFPIVIITVGLLKLRHLGWRALVILLVAASLLLLVGYSSIIKPKFERTLSEIDSFSQTNGNEVTSLSTRLSMWRVGIACFLEHPWGMSQEDRITWFKQYVDEHHTDSASLAYVNVHLHNEVIETASLQGIQGLLALFFFYGVILCNAWRRHNAVMLSIALVVIISGLTDVIFISRDQCIFFPLMFIFAILWHKEIPKIKE